MYSTVYQLTFPDGSRYVGKTTDLDKRIIQHRSQPVNNLVKDKIDKFGVDGFEIEVLYEDLFDGFSSFVEKYEIRSTPSHHCLNINCTNKPKYSSFEPERELTEYQERYSKRVKDVEKACKKLLSELYGLNALYKEDAFDGKEELEAKLKLYLKYLQTQ